MGLPFFFQFKPCGPLRFSLFPKWLNAVESFGGRTLDLRQLLLALLPSAGNSALQSFLPQRYASLARSPALEFITIQSAAPGFAYSEGAGWNSELVVCLTFFQFLDISLPKYSNLGDLVRREDSQFMESPAGLPIPRLNFTNSVASRQFIKLFAHVFQR